MSLKSQNGDLCFHCAWQIKKAGQEASEVAGAPYSDLPELPAFFNPPFET